MAVILTAMDVEYVAVREHLSNPLQEREERGTVYEVGSFSGRRGAWTIAIAQTGQGTPDAGIQLERAVQAFSPEVVLFVGVAGGRKDVALGDVVTASEVYHYEAGKDAERETLSRIKMAAPSFRLVQRAMAVATRSEWQHRIKPQRPEGAPRAFVKPIAAGGKVIAHDRSRTARLLDRYCGDALAVEMEGFGFLRGAYANTQIEAIVVRGISDLLTGKDAASDLLWQPVAARHAAAFAFELLSSLNPHDRPSPLLEDGERLELYQLVSGVRCGAVAAMYRDAVGPFGPALSLDAHDLVAVARELEEVSSPPYGPPPLVLFLERVARQVGGQAGEALREWNDGLALRLRLDPHHLEAARAVAVTPSQPSSDRAYVIIQLQEDGVDVDRYLVSVWLQHGSAPGESLHQEDEPRILQQIPDQVDLILSSILNRTDRDFRELVVEFVLPRHLLSHAVDQWPVRFKLGFARRLGIEFPVIVRSLERLRNPSMHAHWRRKWEWLRANGHLTDIGSALYWVRTPGQNPEALMSELIIDPKPVCLILAFRPADQRELGQDELAAGLHAGAPIILFCRDDRSPQRFEAELRDLLDGKSLNELPELTLRLRRDAVRLDQPADHLGLHLTLLWDDADRMPEPPVLLQAPL